MNSVASLLRFTILSKLNGGLFPSWAVRSLCTQPQLPSINNAPSRLTPMFGLGQSSSRTSGLLAPSETLLGGVSGRTNIRDHFPKPSEVKRIKRHGWRARMATLQGRRTLMRRILKGRYIYSH